MPTQAEKARAFRALHERPGAFLVPNPYDIGTARLLERLGFEALATTSAGFAFSQGRLDNTVGRELMLRHVSELAAATGLPVSADLENGFGDDAATVAETVRMAVAAGLAGCSIEDSTGRADAPIYGRAHAVERIRAAVEVVRGLPFPFVLTARAENFLHGREGHADTIARLQGYQEAGADVLYAPGLKRPEDIGAVVRAVDRPVNVLMSIPGVPLDLAGLAALGVKRVSVGGALARAALGAFLRAAREMRDHGTFGFTAEAVTSKDLGELLGG